jgi:hypothetical protein
MNHSSGRSLVLVCGLLFSAASVFAAPAATGKAAGAGSKATVNFGRTKARIDALLAQRLKPGALPDTLPNPFQLAETTPLPSSHEKDAKPPTEGLLPGSDSEMLLYYGATLRISGTVRINDQTHLIINQAPYKEGDNFTLRTKDAVVRLRIIGIAPGELTLGLNDAVQVIKFKK